MWISRLRNVVLVVGLATLGAFWFAFVSNSAAQQSLAAAWSAHPQPPLLNGLLFNPDGLLLMQPHLQGPRPKGGRHTIVFVMSDECAPCLRQAPLWTEFIAKVPIEESSLLFVSFVGDQLVSQLAAVARNRGIAFESHFIRQRQAFGRSTGVSSTPKVIVLDEGKRVRLAGSVFDEAMTDDISALISQAR